MEEADETDQEIDLETDGEDQEVGLEVIEDEEDHIQEADLEATKDQEEEIHAVDLEVKGKDPPPEIETDQDLNPNLVPDQDQENEQHKVHETNTSIMHQSLPPLHVSNIRVPIINTK